MKEESVATIMGRRVLGFTYPERFCPYCEKVLELVQVAHIGDSADFKAVYVCTTKKCGAFEEDARSQYVKVYYSSTTAFQQLEGYRIYMPVDKKD